MSAHHSAPEMFSNGGDLEFIGVDHRLTLRFSEGDVVTIETEFALTRPGSTEVLLDPDGDKKALGEVLALFGRRVTGAEIVSHELRIAFDDSTVLRIPPDPDYEAWSYSGPGNPRTLVISMPGGDLTIWTS
ncbi:MULTISPECIES: DUF6188 family protein [Microbacterium]|uniref:DUF6188 family protein n=1 Tax=Microbacterium TaxID=33882 RepID=UPI0023DBFF83|nr:MULTISPECIES: DUF6188 family protein [Microbacterium]MDF2047032.1 DUF6188 family protein [Microbacterium sp. Kw_RZR3]MDQ1076880.1 hypothetical protein [Microbacterium sp. SORGH_AS_0969]MDQ1117117.1 hypothetical protein [Microbacterium testaceum]